MTPQLQLLLVGSQSQTLQLLLALHVLRFLHPDDVQCLLAEINENKSQLEAKAIEIHERDTVIREKDAQIASMEQLVAYDRSVIVGILGGPAGTTHDAFRMLWEAKKYGGRAALFGRKINQAEDQLLFVEILRALADGNADPEESVRDYHGQLQQRGLTPHRPLEEDLVLTQLDAS